MSEVRLQDHDIPFRANQHNRTTEARNKEVDSVVDKVKMSLKVRSIKLPSLHYFLTLVALQNIKILSKIFFKAIALVFNKKKTCLYGMGLI